MLFNNYGLICSTPNYCSFILYTESNNLKARAFLVYII